MDLHEYQAKQIFKKNGIPCPPFFVASSMEEAKEILSMHPLERAVVKVQILAGGRGKAGGVRMAKNKDEILHYCSQLLGMKIVNCQTGPDGMVASRVLITPPMNIAQEYYLGVVIDRLKATSVLIASNEGGMEIEEVAAHHPEKIIKVPIQENGKIRSFHVAQVVKFLGWQGDVAKKGADIIKALAFLSCEYDVTMVEINPLVLTTEGDLTALDAKLSIDDNALYRQEELADSFDVSQLSAKEQEARRYDLSYVALKGSIGCMVNGAGLAMATMDLIHLHGGSPANFLDVGGGASQEKVAAGFKIILSDPDVKAILVNIFGGIMNCATLASGLISAAKEIQVSVPIVARMEGTNVEEGKRIIKNSGLPIHVKDDLDQAAQTVVELSKN